MFNRKKNHLPELPWPKQRKTSKKKKLARVGMGAAGVALIASIFTKKDRNP